MGLDVHRCPIAEASRNACAGSGTSVDSESSVDVALALIYIKSLRNAVQWTNASHGLKFHFTALDQYQ
jgi:hypothetical protein